MIVFIYIFENQKFYRYIYIYIYECLKTDYPCVIVSWLNKNGGSDKSDGVAEVLN